MSLNLWYSFRDGMAGFRRARLASFITVSAFAVTLTILGFFLFLTVNIQKNITAFKDKMTLEAFLQNGLSTSQVSALKDRIIALKEVDEASFVSQDRAVAIFKEQMGEDVLELLGDNPLPASFHVLLKENFRRPEYAERVVGTIETFEGVDEVVYHRKLFRFIDRTSRIILYVDAGLFLVVFFSSIVLVANTIRLAIFSQRRTIEIMELVGATSHFIRRPFVILGMAQGWLGGLVASGLVWLTIQGIHVVMPRTLASPVILYAFPPILGVVLGWIGSEIGLKRFLSRI